MLSTSALIRHANVAIRRPDPVINEVRKEDARRSRVAEIAKKIALQRSKLIKH